MACCRAAVAEHELAQRADEIVSWCNNVQLQLEITDLGKDVSTVNMLIKRHRELEADVAARETRVQVAAPESPTASLSLR